MKNFEIKLKTIRDHNPGINLYTTCAGAGAGLIKVLWEIPGASSFLIGSSFPYSTDNIDDFLGFKTEAGYCNQEMAMNLALESYLRALKVGNTKDGKMNVGLGLSASVTSTREHRGEHRVHVAIVTDDDSIIYNVTLNKNCTSRINDGYLSDLIALCCLFNIVLKKQQEHVDLLQKLKFATKNIEILDGNESNKIMSECFWKRPFFDKNNKRHTSKVDNEKTAYLAGSFNPPHEGHFGMANEYMETIPGASVIFSISGDHPVKGNLNIQELLWRSKLLSGHNRLFTLSEPLFLDKAHNNPNRPFIIGSDTLIQLLDPKWGPSTQEVIDGFKQTNTQLYVAIREGTTELGQVTDLNYIKLNGKWEISSTELRKKHE